MHRLVVALITGVVFICSSAHQASAVIAFKKEFQKLWTEKVEDMLLGERGIDKWLKIEGGGSNV